MTRLRTVANAIGVLLFAALFLVFVVQISARFVFDKPLPWADEAALVLYLWVVLWGAAVVCRDREHVAFDLLYQSASPALKRMMAMLASALIAALCVWALPGVLDYIVFMRRESTPVMGLAFMWVFLPFALLLICIVIRYVLRILILMRSGWERHL